LAVTGLRIVHIVCTDAFAGVERYVLSSALNLTREGCTVTVIGGSEAAMRGPLAEGGVDWFPGSTVREALRSLRAVARPDVINTHMTNADFAGVIAARRLKAPVLSTRHFASRRGSSLVLRIVSAWIARRISGQIAISHFVAANIEGSATVVHTGVESVQADTLERERIVLVAQRLEAEKHTEIALRAWAGFADRSGWRLQVAGDGAQLAELTALAKSLGITDSVEFLGFRTDVAALLARASIFVAPTPREGLGLSVIEAMSHGLPVVAAAGGGHLESVGAVSSPALFAPGDHTEAAAQLARLVHDPDERQRYGRALQARQRASFNVHDQTVATLAVLRSVAGIQAR
jgi:glycosyltransferase involved in cell wall biosynthesis